MTDPSTMTSTARAKLIYRLTVARNVAGTMPGILGNAIEYVRMGFDDAPERINEVIVGLRMLGQMGREIEGNK